jgi:hypothetical protein
MFIIIHGTERFAPLTPDPILALRVQQKNQSKAAVTADRPDPAWLARFCAENTRFVLNGDDNDASASLKLGSALEEGNKLIAVVPSQTRHAVFFRARNNSSGALPLSQMRSVACTRAEDLPLLRAVLAAAGSSARVALVDAADPVDDAWFGAHAVDAAFLVEDLATVGSRLAPAYRSAVYSMDDDVDWPAFARAAPAARVEDVDLVARLPGLDADPELVNGFMRIFSCPAVDVALWTVSRSTLTSDELVGWLAEFLLSSSNDSLPLTNRLAAFAELDPAALIVIRRRNARILSSNN